jgi:cyclic pyranopterin phosphate synthase
MSAEGRLYTCLFARSGLDMRAMLRDGMGDAELEARIGETWGARSDRYSAERAERMAARARELATSADVAAAHPRRQKIEMSYIGG